MVSATQRGVLVPHVHFKMLEEVNILARCEGDKHSYCAWMRLRVTIVVKFIVMCILGFSSVKKNVPQ